MSPRARDALQPHATPPELIRNFCIIAHIDHGKSTLADRMLQLTGVVDDRSMRAQYLDRMDIERERGITIKSQAVRMPWESAGQTYALNMIDTPELAGLIGCAPQDCLQVSGKTGAGVEALLDEIVRQVPAPVGDPEAPARAMIFDSVYDTYRGVVTYVRVIDGNLNPRERIVMMSTRATHELLEIGVISPEPVPSKGLGVGEVGYLITGVKDVRQSRVGDTVTNASKPATVALGGYRDPKPMVFSGLYPIDGSDYPALREALDKLKLNDAALAYEPETSAALGFGFRCGFLGLLHLEIVRERLEREFGLDLISTLPNVVYSVTMEDGGIVTVTNPSEFPGGKIAEVREPVVRATILAPSDFIGAIMELCQAKRGTLRGMDYLSEDRVEMPKSSMTSSTS